MLIKTELRCIAQITTVLTLDATLNVLVKMTNKKSSKIKYDIILPLLSTAN